MLMYGFYECGAGECGAGFSRVSQYNLTIDRLTSSALRSCALGAQDLQLSNKLNKLSHSAGSIAEIPPRYNAFSLSHRSLKGSGPLCSW